MPKTTQSGKPKAGELPGTLKRSPKKAQRTFAVVHDSAAEQYGEKLYRQAADAGIVGRSKMNKLELARALARKS